MRQLLRVWIEPRDEKMLVKDIETRELFYLDATEVEYELFFSMSQEELDAALAS